MRQPRHLVLDCPFCRMRVRGEAGDAMEYGGEGEQEIRVTLVRCPGCSYPLVAYEEACDYEQVDLDKYETIWSRPARLWPKPRLNLSGSIPEKIAASLNEAQACLTSGTFTASVAMSGRALEDIGRHFHTKGRADRLMLAEGLDELYSNTIIDKRLYEWGKELKENRNLAAHASDQTFDRDDAEDLFDFAMAICEYVFVLTERFDAFKTRQQCKKMLQQQQQQ